MADSTNENDPNDAPKEMEAKKVFEYIETLYEGDNPDVVEAKELAPGAIYLGLILVFLYFAYRAAQRLRKTGRRISQTAETASTFGKYGDPRTLPRISSLERKDRAALLILPLSLLGILGAWGALTDKKPPPEKRSTTKYVSTPPASGNSYSEFYEWLGREGNGPAKSNMETPDAD